MKLDGGRDGDREDLDVLLPQARIEAAADARRLYRRCYGTRAMPEESDRYLIERFVTRNVPDPDQRP